MKRLIYAASVVAYVLIAVPAHGDDVLMGPRLRRIVDSGRGFSQDQGAGTPAPAASPSPAPVAFDDRPAKVYATAGYEFASSGVTPNVGQVVGIIGGSAPVKVGGFRLRPSFRIAFAQLAGETSLDPKNFSSLEGMVGVSHTVSEAGGFRLGVTARVWANQKLSHGDPAPPVDPATYGWGVGLEGHGVDGTHVTLVVGQDTYVGDSGGVQARLFGKIAVPGTSVGGEKIGSLIFDARLSFVSPVPAIAPPTVTASPHELHTLILYGVAIEAAPLWSALVHPGASAAAPSARMPASDARAADAAFGPPAPRS